MTLYVNMALTGVKVDLFILKHSVLTKEIFKTDYIDLVVMDDIHIH